MYQYKILSSCRITQRESDLSLPSLLSPLLLFCFVALIINEKENVECHTNAYVIPVMASQASHEIEIPFEARSSVRKYETSQRLAR